jgi:hypothetical protein
MMGLMGALGASGATAATTAATLFSVGGSLVSGVAGYQAAQAEKERAKVNAYIGRTRAMQTDVSARQGMESELGTMRSALAANMQKQNVGTAEVFNELRTVRGRERRIEVGNRMAEAADWKMAAKNASAAGTGKLLGGLIKAGPGIFDLYQLKRK